MKDLLLYVADADAQAFLGAILNKPLALGVRQITYDIERHPLRDSGMVQSGYELARIKKGKYHKAILTLDYHGSGRDHKQSSEELQKEIQNKLNDCTWSNHSSVIIFVAELEQWLWYAEQAIISYYGISLDQLTGWAVERAKKLGTSVEKLKAEQPKELFEYIVRERLKTTISPRDFEEIGKRTSINRLMECASFRFTVDVLRTWFPQ